MLCFYYLLSVLHQTYIILDLHVSFMTEILYVAMAFNGFESRLMFQFICMMHNKARSGSSNAMEFKISLAIYVTVELFIRPRTFIEGQLNYTKAKSVPIT